jgi:UDP-N-acetylmuramoylalanine--D-glutamate ligase
VSSFQLDHVHTFRPRVSVLLNITPDHLDRYDHSLNDYAQSKFRIFARQGAGDVLVYNHDDALVRAYVAYAAPRRGVRTLGLSVKGPLPRAASDAAVPAGGAYLCDDVLYLHLDANAAPDALMPADEVALRGTHNLYNALAAAVAARTMEVARDAVREGLARFEGVPHRLETVRTVGGVRYVNDSKATNVRAVWYALGSFRAPVVLIAGGRDKGNDYGPLKPLVRAHVRAVVALGESAETVLRDLGAEAPASVHATSMDDALRHARRLAAPGDVVLLSPACSSFDMFEHYEDRGDTFKRLVQAL